MEAIYIPQLIKAPKQTETVEVDEFLPDLETLTPVRGRVTVTHKGNYLEVSWEAEAIMTLTCHRCLQQFNRRLAVKNSELIWLEETAGDNNLLEREVALEDLMETLAPNGYFYPDRWLYEQMSLAIPQQQPCEENCQGIQVVESGRAEPVVDRRWASLEAIKKQLKNG